MGNKKTPMGYMEALRRLKQAGISGSPQINRQPNPGTDELPTLEERVAQMLGLVNQPNRKAGNMLFFVMYDIESNKVRYNVVKYLERQGCFRIQKSIFLADLPGEKYNAIRSDLEEIQSLYENHDSIIVCPISTDLLQSMKVIGQNVNVSIIAEKRNTLFF